MAKNKDRPRTAGHSLTWQMIGPLSKTSFTLLFTARLSVQCTSLDCTSGPKHHPLSPSHLRLLPQFRKVVKRHWTPPVGLLNRRSGMALHPGSMWSNTTTCSPLATLFANFRGVVFSTWLQSSQSLDLQTLWEVNFPFLDSCLYWLPASVGSTGLQVKLWSCPKVWLPT